MQVTGEFQVSLTPQAGAHADSGVQRRAIDIRDGLHYYRFDYQLPA